MHNKNLENGQVVKYLYYNGNITYGGESGSPMCIK